MSESGRPISTRCATNVTVEYYDARSRRRVTRTFATAREARAFYLKKNRIGREPKVVSRATAPDLDLLSRHCSITEFVQREP